MNISMIDKLNKIHDNKYNYNLLEFKNVNDVVKIICPVHGVFEQQLFNHINGSGCSICSKNKKPNEKEFIRKLISIYDIFGFDYSLVKYINAHTKVKIICSKHGVFEQTPNNLLNGFHCKKCKREDRIKSIVIDIINRSNIKHNNKYRYDNINYIEMNKYINITCPTHGDFKQTPNNHINGGKGCKKCSKNRDLNTDDFIILSNLRHNDYYKYNYTIYEKTSKKVIITCPIHGDFKQSPNNHLDGHGCPICKESKGEKMISDILIKNKIKFIRQKKFNNCENKRKLPFDFYLTEYNTIIEFDGIQHFKPIEYFGGLKSYNIIKKHDEIKNFFCKNNNINIIRIKYDFDYSSIEKIITKIKFNNK